MKDVTGFSYLPNIDEDSMRDVFATEKWEQLNTLIDQCNYERIGFDRFFLIESDLRKRYGEERLSVLDVGCNNGLIARSLALVGHRATGIDNGIIDTQSRYDNLTFLDTKDSGTLDLINISMEDYFKETTEKWDCILLLSILHQLENGYAFNPDSVYEKDEILSIVKTIFDRAKRVVYYECPYDEDGFEYEYGLHFLHRYLSNIREFTIEEVAKTIGPNGVIRQLFAIVRK